MKTNKKKPEAKCFDKDWKYITSHKTNILDRFKKLGWIPPSELKESKTNG
jgi:hypothetical protein